MIIDARTAHTLWWICYDARRCQVVNGVVWVNDETAQWGGYDMPPKVIGGEIVINVHQEERIAIYPGRLLVVFNEVDIGEPADLVDAAAPREPVTI